MYIQQAYAIFCRTYLSRYHEMKWRHVWLLVMPCLPLFLYSILNRVGVFGMSDTGVPRAAMLSVGITFYYVISETVVGLSGALHSNSAYIKKTGVGFLPCFLSVIMSVITNFIIRFMVLVVMVVIYDSFMFSSILYSLIFFFAALSFGCALGLFLSLFTTYYRDLDNVIQALSFYMLFGSGVFGKIEGDSIFEIFLKLLPNYKLVDYSQHLFINTPTDVTQYQIWIIIACSLVLSTLFSIGLRNSRTLIMNYL